MYIKSNVEVASFFFISPPPPPIPLPEETPFIS